MKRIMLVTAYDGTAYNGWQVQDNVKTIEGELNRCLRELSGEDIAVIGASRTDSGVHALCNVAVFDTDSRIPGDKFAYAMNQRLPEDIRIQKSLEVAKDFHPRHTRTRKTYEYRICNREFPIPTRRLYSYFTYATLDVEKMRAGAACLIGKHDFKSFCSPNTTANSTIREIYDIGVIKENDDIVIRVSGGGFLYNMVRIIAGTLMDVGKGRTRPEQIKEILEARDRVKAGPTAPARGLTLVEYSFLEYDF